MKKQSNAKQRSIKFRAFVDGRMVYPTGALADLRRFFRIIPEGVPLMQFSGLKDSGGEDIYEGDIVKLDGGGDKKPVGQVIFKDGAFRFVADWTPAENNHPELLAYTIFGDLSDQNYFKDCITVEIIGNIYETPELI